MIKVKTVAYGSTGQIIIPAMIREEYNIFLGDEIYLFYQSQEILCSTFELPVCTKVRVQKRGHVQPPEWMREDINADRFDVYMDLRENVFLFKSVKDCEQKKPLS